MLFHFIKFLQNPLKFVVTWNSKKVKTYDDSWKVKVWAYGKDPGWLLLVLKLKLSLNPTGQPSGKLFMMRFWNIAEIPDSYQGVAHYIFLPMSF